MVPSSLARSYSHIPVPLGAGSRPRCKRRISQPSAGRASHRYARGSGHALKALRPVIASVAGGQDPQQPPEMPPRILQVETTYGKASSTVEFRSALGV
ncbi:hypothetical protein VTO73DRAFT_13525 [Trametes versicolor]